MARHPTDGLRIPKLCGADVELGNFVLGLPGDAASARVAARMLLAEIAGLPDPDAAPGAAGRDHAQDWGRRYLAANGGCAYIDLDHLELCIPEVRSAWDHVAAWHAMLRIARRALAAANRKLPDGLRIQVLVNNSDGCSNAYGSHLNVLIGRRTWENVFERKLHQMLFLAAYQASAIVFTGQGKVGAENRRPPVAYQIAQRADFFETLCGPQTTVRRPLVNARDEALCGQGRHRPPELARLHCIFFDNTLCPVASLLKVGVLQIVLAMIEADRVNPALILDDPVRAVARWSHDPGLETRAPTVAGERLTAVELQLRFAADAARFVADGGCDGVVPGAGELLALWQDTLAKLAAGDLDALVPRLDWVLKRHVLERAMRRHPDLAWGSRELKYLDHLYGSLDEDEGLYWAFERAGLVERVVAEEAIDHFVHEPPEDTRAWTRAMVLRAAGATAVRDVDWDRVRIACRQDDGGIAPRTLELANPLAHTRAESAPVFAAARSLGDLMDGLAGATRAATGNDEGGEHAIS